MYKHCNMDSIVYDGVTVLPLDALVPSPEYSDQGGCQTTLLETQGIHFDSLPKLGKYRTCVVRYNGTTVQIPTVQIPSERRWYWTTCCQGLGYLERGSCAFSAWSEFIVEKRTFLCIAPQLRKPQSVNQSTTEAQTAQSPSHYGYRRGLNPRRLA